MSEEQFFGIAASVMLGVILAVAMAWLLFGAFCLHWTVRRLKFKKPKFSTAVLTNLLLVVVPTFGWGGTYFASAKYAELEAALLLVASLVSFFICLTVIKAMYRVTYGKALLAYLLSSLVGALLVFAIGMVVLLVAAGGIWLFGTESSAGPG